nr:MAG TPA: centrosome-associated protein [Caudoviricetes sp.]
MTSKRLEVYRVAKGFNQNVSLIQSSPKRMNIKWLYGFT